MMCTDEFKKGGVQMMEHECVDLFYNYSYSCYKAGAGLGVKRQYLALELCVIYFGKAYTGQRQMDLKMRRTDF